MTSSNLTELRGLCPAPFLDKSKFPNFGGNIDGRLCAPLPQLIEGLTCCLPCPFTEWIYPPEFETYYRVSEGFAAAGLGICIFLLVTWIVLPPEKTRRHYLSICLVAGIFLMALGFVVPLGVRPPQCYNEITPNDMYSNLTCAFSGAFLILGGLTVTVWILIRALSMHLQICWDIVPGKRFFYVSQAAGWGVTAIIFVATMAITGVSFRFGDACHVNAKHSKADYWGPLLGMAASAGVVQILTFMYCIKVYIQNMWSDEKTETCTSAGLPSYTSSIRAHSIRAVYRRMKKVLWLQWRSITIVIFLLADLIFFSIIWIQLDHDVNEATSGNIQPFLPFLTCLFTSQGDKSKCYKHGQRALINESTAIAILMLLSLTGVQAGILMARMAMFSCWWELLTRRFRGNKEFVSLDAKHLSSDQRAFELLKVGSPMTPDMKVAIATPNQMHTQPPQEAPDYFGKQNNSTTREWRKPTMSFAGPQAPSNAANRMDWEQPPSSRGGLGLHPPQSPGPNSDVGSPQPPNLHRPVDERQLVRFDFDTTASNEKSSSPVPRHFI